MVIPRDAVDLEDWKLMQQGLPPRPKPKKVYVEPEPPVVPNLLRVEDIPQGEIVDILARRQTQKNKDGMMFCGMSVWVKLDGDRVFEGWCDEGNFLKLKKRIPEERTDLIGKIGW